MCCPAIWDWPLCFSVSVCGTWQVQSKQRLESENSGSCPSCSHISDLGPWQIPKLPKSHYSVKWEITSSYRAVIVLKTLQSFFSHDFIFTHNCLFFVSWDILKSSKNAHMKASEMPEANQFILTLTDFFELEIK